MGTRYVQHSDMCGCERCAIQADREHPALVFDMIEDPEVLDCGCSVYSSCDCARYED